MLNCTHYQTPNISEINELPGPTATTTLDEFLDTQKQNPRHVWGRLRQKGEKYSINKAETKY